MTTSRTPLRRAGAGREPAGLLASLRQAVDIRIGFAIVLFCLSAMMGAAHKPIVLGEAAQQVGSATTSTIDANGLVICNGSARTPGGRAVASSICDACLVTAAPGLVGSPAVLPLPGNIQLAQALAPEVRAPDALDRTWTSARGPPIA
ncbi:hypothetical protein [Oryzibacter oryziterrae]|uniref:hypothetical protein n=1 Tax=Oryzibacter oryziterrae TaxID=2766474 RepID=UPI001F1B3CEC|nr:hypothetical protein [Oryzibacter oryziterrae]